jgi:hypothetical protein
MNARQPGVSARTDQRPIRIGALVFASKVAVHRVLRTVKDRRAPVPLHRKIEHDLPFLLSESRTPLWSEIDPGEARLQMGKVQNLRIVASKLDRLFVGAGEHFSFWRHVGKPVKRAGFVEGRQLQEGCIVPAVAGGICQLSNALYDLALKAGFEILERHPHSRAIPRSGVQAGRDATVAWNHIDLRFRARSAFQLRVFLTATELVVQIRSQERGAGERIQLLSAAAYRQSDVEANSCATCGEEECFRQRAFDHRELCPRTAFLVDQVWPEYAQYLREHAGAEDVLFMPIDGMKWRLRRYAWPKEGFSDVHAATVPTLERSWKSRKLAQQGAARREAAFDADEKLADSFAARLPFDASHLVVYQSLLPFLWRAGVLGGRTFDVLMQRLPIRKLQEELDRHLARNPERRLLGDYRAPEWIAEAEEQAFAAARHIVTPHKAIATLFGERSMLLPWSMPATRQRERGSKVVFPGPTVARKGCYELREALENFDAELVTCGSELEGPDFWRGHRQVRAGQDWLDGANVVVQPAIVEEQPRKLLQALAAGIPVIATPACGLNATSGVTVVEPGDVEGLKAALATHLGSA